MKTRTGVWKGGFGNRQVAVNVPREPLIKTNGGAKARPGKRRVPRPRTPA